MALPYVAFKTWWARVLSDSLLLKVVGSEANPQVNVSTSITGNTSVLVLTFSERVRATSCNIRREDVSMFSVFPSTDQ